jgi:hypothetical protein
MTLNGSRGSYDVHTPKGARKYLFPSIEEKRLALRAEKVELEEEREELYNRLGRPNKNNIRKHRGAEHEQGRFPVQTLKRFFECGQRIAEIGEAFSDLEKEFQQVTSENYETTFVRAAKNLLPPDTFERVDKYTHLLLRELRNQVFQE